jgi:hypothetical protein
MPEEVKATAKELARRDEVYMALMGNLLTHRVAEFLANLEGRVYRLEQAKRRKPCPKK